jgi:ferrous iron transport protein B
LLDTSGYLEGVGMPGVDDHLLDEVKNARSRLAEAGYPVPAVEAMARYQWAGQVTQGAVKHSTERRVTWSDRVDQLLTHKTGGSVVFAIVMLLMFQSVFWVAEPASAAIDWLNRAASDFVTARLAEGALQSLLVNGVIEGVGGVLVFLPQILVLFLFIAILEDCGYMARAAYLMDRLMSRIGLSGKSFIPLLSSFACAVPGIMSARVIENPRDRLTTIVIAPLMSCSARLPVYTLLIGAFIPNTRYLGGLFGLRGLTMFGMYAIGIVTAVIVAFVLRKTLIRGAAPPFILELPAYKLPGAGLVCHRVMERGWDFVQRAGTLILAVTIIVWAAAYYPRDPSRIDPDLLARQTTLEDKIETRRSAPERSSEAEDLSQLTHELNAVKNSIRGAYLRDSYLGRVGRWVEPAVKPLGWDWRVGCAVIASFPAREVVIATLAVIYNLSDEEDDRSETLRETLRSATWEGSTRPVFNVPVALSIMVFFALCAQCASTLVIMRRETNSWRWPLLTFAYMTIFAYLGALATYQIGIQFIR